MAHDENQRRRQREAENEVESSLTKPNPMMGQYTEGRWLRREWRGRRDEGEYVPRHERQGTACKESRKYKIWLSPLDRYVCTTSKFAVPPTLRLSSLRAHSTSPP